MARQTHTYATLEVPATLFNEIVKLLRRAGGQEHRFVENGEVIDMHGIGLTIGSGVVPTEKEKKVETINARDLDVHVFRTRKGQEIKTERARLSPRIAHDPAKPWCVLYRGAIIHTSATQVDAVTKGRIQAQSSKCDLVVHGRNGRIRRKDSFGKDSRKRKG